MAAIRIGGSGCCVAWLGGCGLAPPAENPAGAAIPEMTSLLGVTGRTIPPGQSLALTFTPEANKPVIVTVQASSDAANPDFWLVRGEFDIDDLQTTPIANLVRVSDEDDDGEEIAAFLPDVAEPYTIFIDDRHNTVAASFSVAVTQER